RKIRVRPRPGGLDRPIVTRSSPTRPKRTFNSCSPWPGTPRMVENADWKNSSQTPTGWPGPSHSDPIESDPAETDFQFVFAMARIPYTTRYRSQEKFEPDLDRVAWTGP